MSAARKKKAGKKPAKTGRPLGVRGHCGKCGKHGHNMRTCGKKPKKK